LIEVIHRGLGRPDAYRFLWHPWMDGEIRRFPDRKNSSGLDRKQSSDQDRKETSAPDQQQTSGPEQKNSSATEQKNSSAKTGRILPGQLLREFKSEGGEGESQPPLDLSSATREDGWPEEDLWLRNFLIRTCAMPALGIPFEHFDDPEWWSLLSKTCGGLDEEFLTAQFSKIALHLKNEPEKRPEAKRDWCKFVSAWLQREHRWAEERKRENARHEARP
jgi:hypothetical protein